MDTYTKDAEQSEYEYYKLFLESDINTPAIIVYDEERGKLSTALILSKVVSSIDYFIHDAIVICLNLITEVEKLHNLGYVHGDLNPSNVIIGNDNQVFLIDFEFSGKSGSSVVSKEEK